MFGPQYQVQKSTEQLTTLYRSVLFRKDYRYDVILILVGPSTQSGTLISPGSGNQSLAVTTLYVPVTVDNQLTTWSEVDEHCTKTKRNEVSIVCHTLAGIDLAACAGTGCADLQVVQSRVYSQ